MVRSRRARGQFGRSSSCNIMQGGLIAFCRQLQGERNTATWQVSDWKHAGCSNVLNVALQARKIIMGALQRIDGQAGCNPRNSVARHGQYQPHLCASPFLSLYTFPYI